MMEQEFPADIVLLGHGSHRTDATDVGLADATMRLQRLVGPGPRVRMAGFEFTRPNLAEAVAGLVEAGSRRIVVVPFFLFDGRHITEEIPEQLEELADRFPDLELRYARTFGVHTSMIEICTERAALALSGRSLRWPDARRYLQAQRKVGIVLAARGSQPRYDPGIRRDCLARWIDMALGDGVTVVGCQAEYASPSVPEAVDALAAQGVQRIVVLPYLFFPGKVLYDNIIPDTEKSRARRPNLDIRLADTLGVDDRMITLALSRAWDAALHPEPARIYAARRPERPQPW